MSESASNRLETLWSYLVLSFVLAVTGVVAGAALEVAVRILFPSLGV